MKISNLVVLVSVLILWFSMPFYEFFMLFFLGTLGIVTISFLKALLFAFAHKTALGSGAISKLQKEDERRYMPKELLEKKQS